MKINFNEVIIGVDVDGTLVRRVAEDYSDGKIVRVTNPYDRQTYKYQVHEEHVELLRQYKGRGFYIIVWSANGVKHAESVVTALGLNDGTVDQVMTKCMKTLDDDPKSVLGSSVFISKENFNAKL